MKRLTWFIGGVATGAAGISYAKRKVKATADRLAPVNVARSATAAIKHKSHDLVDAVREGRDAMKAKEAELLARRDGHAVVDLADGTILMPPDDGEDGQVILLRDVRSSRLHVPGGKKRNAR